MPRDQSIRSSHDYRERAEYFRRMAETEANERIRGELLKMASDYEDAAIQLEVHGR